MVILAASAKATSPMQHTPGSNIPIIAGLSAEAFLRPPRFRISGVTPFEALAMSALQEGDSVMLESSDELVCQTRLQPGR